MNCQHPREQRSGDMQFHVCGACGYWRHNSANLPTWYPPLPDGTIGVMPGQKQPPYTRTLNLTSAVAPSADDGPRIARAVADLAKKRMN